MDKDPRDILWVNAYNLYYQVRYEEMLLSRLLTLWGRFDASVRFLVACTVTGSAVAGWAFWGQPGFHLLWEIIAGIGSVLAIASSTLGPQVRIKEHSAVRQKFVSLRVRLSLFRDHLACHRDFDLDEAEKKYGVLKTEYADGLNGEQHDILLCGWLENSVQAKLNVEIQKETLINAQYTHRDSRSA